MEPEARIVKLLTPDKFLLDGLWFGPEKARRVIIFIHGLTGGLLSGTGIRLAPLLIDSSTSLLSFNNRGHDIVARIKRADKRKKKGYSSETLGAALELFSDCVFDIEGAVNFAKGRGAKEIFLMGHSTGSQKSVYFLSKRGKQDKVKGTILLSPMSDYADSIKINGREKINLARTFASKLVKKGLSNEFLPPIIWPNLNSAQRFLSLNTPESEEEIFTYVEPTKIPHTLRKIKVPTLVVLGEKDEFRDRSMAKIAKWFTKHLRRKIATIKIVDDADHGFSEKEKEVAKIINSWLSMW